MDSEIVVGTYEDYLVGYRSIESSLDQTFALRCHSGSVKALACSANGSLILSAGYDDTLNVINMKKRKLVCTLDGAINCATFVGNSHVVCGSEDGNVYIYECKQDDVSLRKTMLGHKGPIVDLAAHPSGKILLTLSKDGTMRTWNLIKARSAYVTRMKQSAHIVRWSKCGEKFIIVTNNELHLYNNEGSKEKSVELEKRVNCVEFVNETCFFVATDSGVVQLLDLKLNQIYKHIAHDSRIKSLLCLVRAKEGEVSKIATASSDGRIKLWSFDKQLELIAEVSSGARLTCMVGSTR